MNDSNDAYKKNRCGFWAIIFLFFSHFASNAFSADAPQEQREILRILITGSNIPASEERSDASTTIVTRREIDGINARSTSQLLSQLPGFHVENAASRGNVNAVYLRGAEPNYTAVLVDGVKVNDPTNNRGGAFDFSLIDINTIERIEVVRGPVSSVYGSDAMAGVINIITRKPADTPFASARIDVGSRDMFNASASLAQVFARGNVTLKATHADDGEQIEGGRYEANSASLGGDVDLWNDTTLSYQLSFVGAEAQSFPDNSGGPEYAVIRDVDQRDTKQQHHYVTLKENFNATDHVRFQFNYFESQEQSDNVGIAPLIPAVTSDSDYQRENVLAVYTSKPTAKLDVSFGGEFEWEDGTSDSVIEPAGMNIPAGFDLERSLAALFAEVQYQLSERLQTYAGVRLDWPEDMTQQTSPRVGIKYQHMDTTYRIDWGRGFKLPSFYALAHPLVGNPEFVPETSESLQASVEHDFTDTTRLTLAAFHNRYFDLIDFDNDTNVLVQRTEVEINGFDIALRQRVTPALQLQLQYTGMDLDIVDSGEELLRRPDQLGNLVVAWNVSDDLLLSLAANYVGEVRDSSIPTGTRTLESYTRVDASAGWRIDKHWSVQGAVDNVLDEEYEEAIGFKAPGIGVRVAVSGTL